MNLSGVDLNLLRVLNALLADASTVRTGQRIGLSQSAVSAALARLRLALKDPLFVRQGQRLVPTDFARKLAVPLKGLLEDLGTLLMEPEHFEPQTTTHSITLAGSDFFAEMLMPGLAGLMAQRAPHMRVHLVDLVPDSYTAVLEQEKIDLALIPRSEFPDWIEAQILFHSGFSVIARQGNPQLQGVPPGEIVPIQLFCDLGHVVFSPEGRPQAMGDAALAMVGRARKVVMTIGVFSGVAIAVASSDLVALVPTQLGQKLAPRLGLALYRCPVPLPKPELCMAWHHRNSRAAAHRFVRELIAEVMAPLDLPS